MMNNIIAMLAMLAIMGCAGLTEAQKDERDYERQETAIAKAECQQLNMNVYEHSNGRTWECITDREFEDLVLGMLGEYDE